ncbi:type I-E CRISPR-associated protein Cse2/CasB [Corynebacterium suicordis]|uniref:type I-E CRISPR-associated protein Cse2/CasB n=1 Tax=uncultured Corynebacterium sp. TaxID=159447 RepID=UPI0025971304|nr:type I-E CRISPR-associated protein Cse2/CasB [uncultured Corynebacterium sp.]
MYNSSPSQKLKVHVTQQVTRLQEKLQGGAPSALRDAANLRRSVGKPAGSVPEVYGITLAGLSETLEGTGNNPSRGETIAHLAVSLFALHTQSATHPVHQNGIGFGSALQKFMMISGVETVDDNPLMRRVKALLTADTLDEISVHLRGLVQQLRTESIPLDYGQLAEDLWWLSQEGHRNGVRLKWSRQLYSRPASNAVDEEKTTAPQEV